jgi:hypothetical protein
VRYAKDSASSSARTKAFVLKSNMVSAISATSLHIAAPAPITAAAAESTIAFLFLSPPEVLLDVQEYLNSYACSSTCCLTQYQHTGVVRLSQGACKLRNSDLIDCLTVFIRHPTTACPHAPSSTHSRAFDRSQRAFSISRPFSAHYSRLSVSCFATSRMSNSPGSLHL